MNTAAFRGFVWEPDRNPKEDKDFVTFIAQVEGLSAVPDGRIYMNAFIDTIKGENGRVEFFFVFGSSSVLVVRVGVGVVFRGNQTTVE